jgi:hypothetical protein
MWNNKNRNALWVGMQNGIATLEDSLAVSYKTKYTLAIYSSNHAPWYLLKGIENCKTESLNTAVYRHFICNCQNSEPLVDEWTYEL